MKKDNNKYSLTLKDGQKLSNAIQANKLPISFPCGKNGTCGKCKIKISSGNVEQMKEEEKKYLTIDEIENNIRLACLTVANGQIDFEIMFENNNHSSKILSAFNKDDSEIINPIIKKEFLNLAKPKLDDQRDDFQRVKNALGQENLKSSITTIRKLEKIIREENFQITATVYEDFLLDIEAGECFDNFYSIAVDIGTTTIVAYLIDMNNGNIIDHCSEINAQKSFGDDVISRINYTVENPSGVDELHLMCTKQLNEMFYTMFSKNNISSNDIVGVSIVGNTVISHYLLGLNPINIAQAPFIPVFNDTYIGLTKDVGVLPESTTMLFVLEGASSYVGGDIVAGIISSKIYLDDEISLLIDIGTNGEIVLGNKEKLYCCSTAAGPAFEGSKISHGLGGIAGAINSFKIIDNKITFTTLDNESPIGICGSGILDIVSELLKHEIVDETGSLETGVVENGLEIYKITENISVSSKDIREIQLAKAAIAAGVLTLVDQMKISIDDIKKVYLCGGFGSYMNKESALNIGLIPHQLKGKIKTIGNSAGSGAAKILINCAYIKKLEEIKTKMEYIELSSNAFFRDEYIEQMSFEN